MYVVPKDPRHPLFPSLRQQRRRRVSRPSGAHGVESDDPIGISSGDYNERGGEGRGKEGGAKEEVRQDLSGRTPEPSLRTQEWSSRREIKWDTNTSADSGVGEEDENTANPSCSSLEKVGIIDPPSALIGPTANDGDRASIELDGVTISKDMIPNKGMPECSFGDDPRDGNSQGGPLNDLGAARYGDSTKTADNPQMLLSKSSPENRSLLALVDRLFHGKKDKEVNKQEAVVVAKGQVSNESGSVGVEETPQTCSRSNPLNFPAEADTPMIRASSLPPKGTPLPHRAPLPIFRSHTSTRLLINEVMEREVKMRSFRRQGASTRRLVEEELKREEQDLELANLRLTLDQERLDSRPDRRERNFLLREVEKIQGELNRMVAEANTVKRELKAEAVERDSLKVAAEKILTENASLVKRKRELLRERDTARRGLLLMPMEFRRHSSTVETRNPSSGDAHGKVLALPTKEQWSSWRL